MTDHTIEIRRPLPLRIASLLLTLALIVGPAYFGAVTPEGLGIVSFIVCAAFFVLSGMFLRYPERAPVCWRTGASIALFVAIADVSSFGSVYAYASQMTVLMFALCAVGALVAAYGIGRDRIEELLGVLVVFGTGTVIVGVAALATGTQTLWFIHKSAYLDRLTATFINPNHYACFLNFLLPAAVCFLVQAQGLQRRVWAVVWGILFTGLVLTFSLGGIIAFSAGWIYCATILVCDGTARRRRIVLMISALLVVALVVLGVVVAAAPYSKGISIMQRWHILVGCIQYLSDTAIHHPVRLMVGSGLGTFSLIYNMYHPVLALRITEFAHNDYMQILIELGLVGFLAYGAIWWRCGVWVRQAYRQHLPLMSHALAAALITFVVHGFFDFNLYIFSNALYAFCFVGLYGAVTSTATGRPVRRWETVVLTLLVMILLYHAGASATATMFARRGETVGRYGEYGAAEKLLKGALCLTPGNAELHRGIAEIYLRRAMSEKEGQRAAEDVALAHVHFAQACALSPWDALYCARYATCLDAEMRYVAAEEVLRKAVRLMPNYWRAHLACVEWYVSPRHRMVTDAAREVSFLLDHMHPFLFQNDRERQEVLRALAVLLDVTDDTLLAKLKQRIAAMIAP